MTHHGMNMLQARTERHHLRCLHNQSYSTIDTTCADQASVQFLTCTFVQVKNCTDVQAYAGKRGARAGCGPANAYAFCDPLSPHGGCSLCCAGRTPGSASPRRRNRIGDAPRKAFVLSGTAREIYPRAGKMSNRTTVSSIKPARNRMPKRRENAKAEATYQSGHTSAG